MFIYEHTLLLWQKGYVSTFHYGCDILTEKGGRVASWREKIVRQAKCDTRLGSGKHPAMQG